MRPDQQRACEELLLEAIDWVGMVNLTVEEEELAEELQVEMERLLIDLGRLKEGVRCEALPEEGHDDHLQDTVLKFS